MMMVVVLLSVIFISGVQPLFMVSSMILITLLYSLMVYNVMGGYWFSYALIMVMMSGVLVVFTYMVSMIPNEGFELYNLVVVLFFLMFVLGGYYCSYKIGMTYMCMELWSVYVGMFNIYVVGFLFSIMLMVVWFGYMDSGAFRVN